MQDVPAFCRDSMRSRLLPGCFRCFQAVNRGARWGGACAQAVVHPGVERTLSRGRRAGGGCRAGRGTGFFGSCNGEAVLPGRSPEPVVPVRSAEEAIVSGAALAEGASAARKKPAGNVPSDAGGSGGAEPGIAKVFFVGLRAGGRSLSRGCMEHVWLNGAGGPEACKSVPERVRGQARSFLRTRGPAFSAEVATSSRLLLFRCGGGGSLHAS